MSEFTTEAAAAKARWCALVDQGMDSATQDVFTAAEENATDTGLSEGYDRGAPEWYVMWSDTFDYLKAERGTVEESEDAAKELNPERLEFDDVQAGDILIFLTRDSGYGRSGRMVERMGKVERVTAQTMTLRVMGANPFRESVWERGAAREKGLTARLSRRDWCERNPMRMWDE